MDSKNGEVTFEFPPFIRVYKDARSERILHSEFVSSSLNDPSTGVSSKDVVIDSQTGLSARLYLPKVKPNSRIQLPLLIYIHGGGFCIESAFSPTYHHYLNSLVAQANAVAISVDYRRAPDHPLPVAYDDAWASLQWVTSKFDQEEWLQKYVDRNRVFLAGDSAGANIAHNVVVRAGILGLKELKIKGLVLIHPLFSGTEPVGAEVTSLNHERAAKLWRAVCPTTTGTDDPCINPVKDPNFSKLGCESVLVCVAARDKLRDRGWLYYENLRKSGWNGVAEFMETHGAKHVFHLYDPTCNHAKDLMHRIVSFLSQSH